MNILLEMYAYPTIECKVISGATAVAIKTAFDTWKQDIASAYINSDLIPKIISVLMFGVTDLIIFYFLAKKTPIKI